MPPSSPSLRVLVVDDSSVARRLISQALETEPDIVVAATASDGLEALEAIEESEFDLVMMDVEMPRMDGIAALKEIRKRDRFLPVILFSALSQHGASATIEGLANGANDYCPKPSSASGPEEAVSSIREELIPRVRVHTANARKRRLGSNASVKVLDQGAGRVPPGTRPAQRTVANAGPESVAVGELHADAEQPPGADASSASTPMRKLGAQPKPAEVDRSAKTRHVSGSADHSRNARGGAKLGQHPNGARPRPVLPVTKKPRTPSTHAPNQRGSNRIPSARLVVIGSSTGGPQALLDIVRALPGDFPLPIVVVQHMPKTFTNVLAARLDSLGELKVHEAEEGEPLQRGTILFAPGGMHLEIVARGPGLFAHLGQGAMVNSCRPSVDVTLQSVHRACRGDTIVSILTGMGRDGADGCVQLAAEGAYIIAQDEESSVVWGMPGAVVQEGVADMISPLSEIPSVLTQAARRALGAPRDVA